MSRHSRRVTLLRAAFSSCGIVEAHLAAAGAASAPKPYQAPLAAAEQPLPQPLAITPRSTVHFACPLCGDELLQSAEQRMLRCTGGHAFDVAREGHVHLAKRSKANAAKQAENDEADQLVGSGRIVTQLASLVSSGCLTWPLAALRT